MDNKPTLVLGASLKPDRYSNRAIRSLRHYGHAVTAIGLREGTVGDVFISRSIPENCSIHTLTMYLNAGNQTPWKEVIFRLNPQRVIFNPGAENPDFENELQEKGIEVLEACTLVMLATGQY